MNTVFYNLKTWRPVQTDPQNNASRFTLGPI